MACGTLTLFLEENATSLGGLIFCQLRSWVLGLISIHHCFFFAFGMELGRAQIGSHLIADERMQVVCLKQCFAINRPNGFMKMRFSARHSVEAK
jgi:hypothetical protein